MLKHRFRSPVGAVKIVSAEGLIVEVARNSHGGSIHSLDTRGMQPSDTSWTVNFEEPGATAAAAASDETSSKVTVKVGLWLQDADRWASQQDQQALRDLYFLLRPFWEAWHIQNSRSRRRANVYPQPWHLTPPSHNFSSNPIPRVTLLQNGCIERSVMLGGARVTM